MASGKEDKVDTEPLKNVGDLVEWSVQADGGTRHLSGRVLVVVTAWATLGSELARLRIRPATGAVKAPSTASQPRYLVAVPRPGKRLIIDYHAPLVDEVDAAMRRKRGGA